jgi:predicted histone-like DNA-binding protein
VRVAKSDLIDFQRIKKAIASQCTATEGDVSLSVEQLSCNMANEVGSGNRFHIEGIGYFYLIIETDPTSSAKSINNHQIRVRTIGFTPDKILMSRLAEIDFYRSPIKRHSDSSTYTEKQLILKDFFKHHNTITRAEFQVLLGLTRTTAIRRLNELCEGPCAVFNKGGARNSPVYIPITTSPFWKD